jgi:hypothetical protein
MMPGLRPIAAVLLATIMAQAQARAEQTTPVSTPLPVQGAPQVEAKFVWGVLLQLLVPGALKLFGDWAQNKLAERYDAGSVSRLAALAGGAAIVWLGEYTKVSLKAKGTRDIILVGAPANASLGQADADLKIIDGKENYQGVHIALLGFDAQGNPTGLRTIKDGFTTGERFKVRVLSTFEGLLSFDNINPVGARRQIYPATTEQAVKVPAGKEVLLPIGRDEYFQFAGATGDDKLVVTLRDPRTLSGGQASTATVKRKDEAYGSNFVQEVGPGRYPVIAESITLGHR